MLTMPISGDRKPAPFAAIDGAIDHAVVARMVELREQGFSCRDIAAMLLRKGLTLSSQRVKEILDSHQARLRKP